jgi:hypothetical protein
VVEAALVVVVVTWRAGSSRLEAVGAQVVQVTHGPEQLRRALVVLLRSAEWSCADAAHDLGANRMAAADLEDLAAALDALAGVVRGYRQVRGG